MALRISLIRRIIDKVGNMTDVANRNMEHVS
ncbi:hypothetical protein OA78_2284 [Latilactobacillus curvatus]|nr:hypothetical protein OA78_2284 [Latilactobacillus curvatus]